MWTKSRPHRVLPVLPAALLAFGVSVATPACASEMYGYRVDRYDRYGQFQRVAYDNGFREGLNHGEKDARKGRDFAYAHADEYRDADDGYRRSYGDIESYRRSFRQGYVDGYTQGYGGSHGRFGRDYPRSTYPAYPTYPNYPTYPTSPTYGRYGSPAAQVGYRDGFEVGRDDARDRESYDPIRSRSYRSADHDYDGRYGSKDEYKRVYRDAFRQGYEDGYRGSARRF